MKDKNLKRIEARNIMIKAFGYEGKILPPDFPSMEQVNRRVTGVRYIKNKSEKNNKAPEESSKKMN